MSQYDSSLSAAYPPSGRRLALFAKLVVLATFLLIFRGALVTSWHAGMAVPDWPTSFNSFNPPGWWANFPVYLEHSHRLLAEGVGLLVGCLCAWVWENWVALAVAAFVSGVVPPIAAAMGAAKPVIMHLAIWPAAVAFVVAILWKARGKTFLRSPGIRWLALALFVCVCIQATLGGTRVTEETAGAFGTALILRVLHGSFAQIFVLSPLVALAALLSPAIRTIPPLAATPKLARFAWGCFLVLACQLVLGASMRHMGAGLAIPTFPKASPNGGLLPPVHNPAVDLNFTHTRVGAIAAVVLLIILALRVLRNCKESAALTRPARGILALILLQFVLGVSVLQVQTPPLITHIPMDLLPTVIAMTKTIHTVNGALTLATVLLLALRLSRAAVLFRASVPEPLPTNSLVHAAA